MDNVHCGISSLWKHSNTIGHTRQCVAELAKTWKNNCLWAATSGSTKCYLSAQLTLHVFADHKSPFIWVSDIDKDLPDDSHSVPQTYAQCYTLKRIGSKTSQEVVEEGNPGVVAETFFRPVLGLIGPLVTTWWWLGRFAGRPFG